MSKKFKTFKSSGGFLGGVFSGGFFIDFSSKSHTQTMNNIHKTESNCSWFETCS